MQQETAEEILGKYEQEAQETQTQSAASAGQRESAAMASMTRAQDYFIPKVKLLRSDGASLSAVYESKKQDTWSLILKNKVKEDVSVTISLCFALLWG